MRRHLYWRCLAVLLLAALAWSPALPVTAQGQQPPAPTVRFAAPDLLAPAQPAACSDCLVDQTTSPNGSSIFAQDSTDNQYDTAAADDFLATAGSNSWQITAVEVLGKFNPPGGSPSVDVANVAFYDDAGGSPGVPLFTRAVHPISGTASTGNFFLPLTPTVHLASNATYWVSVQDHQTTSFHCYWKDRGVLLK